MRDLAEKIVACFGHGSVEVAPRQAAAHEAGLLQLNCDKAMQQLSWAPRWNFDRTVEVTAHWYRDVAGGTAARQVTNRQIEQYTES